MNTQRYYQWCYQCLFDTTIMDLFPPTGYSYTHRDPECVLSSLGTSYHTPSINFDYINYLHSIHNMWTKTDILYHCTIGHKNCDSRTIVFQNSSFICQTKINLYQNVYSYGKTFISTSEMEMCPPYFESGTSTQRRFSVIAYYSCFPF